MSEIYERYEHPESTEKKLIRNMVDAIGIYYDPDHPDFIESAKKEDLGPPFMEWYTEEKQFFADGEIWYTWPELVIRIYTDAADSETDDACEKIFRMHDMKFKKKVEYLPELSIRETTYTMEV